MISTHNRKNLLENLRKLIVSVSPVLGIAQQLLKALSVISYSIHCTLLSSCKTMFKTIKIKKLICSNTIMQIRSVALPCNVSDQPDCLYSVFCD